MKLDNQEVVLGEIYHTRGSLQTESNQFQGAYDSMKKRFECTRQAIEKVLLMRPTIHEVIAYSAMGNGNMAISQYAAAEPFYLRALEIWKDLPGD